MNHFTSQRFAPIMALLSGLKSIILCLIMLGSLNSMAQNTTSNADIVDLSERTLYAVKAESDYGKMLDSLAGLRIRDLTVQLNDQSKRMVFWINIYNAFYQILHRDQGIKLPKVFKVNWINIAGKQLSLDDIEHGFLRKHRYKYSLGYFPQFFTARWKKDLEVQTLDYRVNFALNCGAKSCPPIAFYTPADLDDQLNRAAASFLETETVIDESSKTISVTRIMFWFLGDFGGKAGIRLVLEKHLQIDANGYKIQFRDYDWSEDLMNFSDETQSSY